MNRKRVQWYSMVATLFAIIMSPSVIAQSIQRTLGEDDEWEEVSVPQPGTPEFALYEARKALANGQSRDAIELADRWIETHPDHPFLAEAYLVRGRAKQAAGDEYQALFDYEFIARTFPGSEVFIQALAQEYEIARMYAHGLKREFLGMRILDAGDEAEELFIRIQERLPGSLLAQRCGRELADYYYRKRDMDMASVAYDLYVDNYPSADDRIDSMKQLVYANMAKSKGPRFDPSGLYEAEAWLETIDRAHPSEAEQMGADAIRARIRDSDAARMLADVRWYLRRHDEVAAEFTLKRLVRKYATTASGRIAYRMLIDRGWLKPEESESLQPPATESDPAESESADSTDPENVERPSESNQP